MASVLVPWAALTFDRRRLNLPRAIIFAIFAVGAVFGMNAMRIAIFLYIGIQVAADVPIGGSHSSFETLSLLVVVGLARVALQHPVFFR